MGESVSNTNLDINYLGSDSVNMSRDEMIVILEMVTNYNPEYLQTMKLDELERLFKEKA